MKERAREFYDYLVDLVKAGGVVRAQGKKGGLVLAGWSLGATWLSALLTHVASFPIGDVDLKEYVRRIVYYGELIVVSVRPMIVRRDSLFGQMRRMSATDTSYRKNYITPCTTLRSRLQRRRSNSGSGYPHISRTETWNGLG